MNPGLTVIVLLSLISLTSAHAQSLDDLARLVREAANQEASINSEREARFVADRDRQRQLLDEAVQELSDEKSRGDALREEYDRTERELAELETTLVERMGNLGELFGVVRQVAGDVHATLDDSLVTAQIPDRTGFLSTLSTRRELPTVPELIVLWSTMVTEIAESGKVARFTAPVERANGEKQNLEVVRVGVFNATAGKLFLDWDSGKSTDHLIELSRQPGGRFQNLASSLHSASAEEVVPFAVDFTRGQILRAVVKSKTPWERVREDGGPVAWVILGIGALGLAMCLWKAFSLFGTGRIINGQVSATRPDRSNPLGRVLAVYSDNPDTDIETLELKLDEAILRETAPIEIGLNFIKVLFVVAPLLGLLGTVVGMISTFQMITLFGTGDPRMMAGGISTALVTTVLGLVVAIPLTLFHSFLQGRARSLVQVLEEQAAGMIARVAEKRA